MTMKIVGSPQTFANRTNFSNAPEKILVTLSSVKASSGEEAEALLKALGFTQSDIEAFNDKYGIDLKERFAAEFSGKPSRMTKDVSSKAGFQAYIGISRHNYKLLTGFLAERRGIQQIQPKENGSGAAKIGDKNNQARQEQVKLNQLWKDAQIPESSSFGTPSKLRDLKHISAVEMQNISGLPAEDKALAGYIEQRYGDRDNLWGDDKADILQIAKANGVKIENLSVSNGKADFDMSVESLLKLHIPYIGVQEKANITEAKVKELQNNSAFNQFLIGVGEGAWNNLKGTGEAIADPIGTLHAIYEAAQSVGSIAVELAKMPETERLQLYAQLGKAGLKGLGEMTLPEASRHIGNFVGALAVDVALGKGIGTAFTLLKDLKIGSKIIRESVALSKTVKQTLGNIKVPLSDMKVVSDTMGNKWWIQDGELKKLEDVVKMMKSGDESLEMLKGGSTAGTKAIKETAEEGLSEIAQSGLKALRGTLSKEGIAEAKKRLVTLNVARTELMARLDNLIANSNLLSDTKIALSKAKNSTKDHLTQDDLVGALRDVLNKPVKQSGSGYTFDHLGEVQDSLNSLRTAVKSLIREISKTTKGTPEFSELSKDLDAVKEMIRRVEEFLKIK